MCTGTACRRCPPLLDDQLANVFQQRNPEVLATPGCDPAEPCCAASVTQIRLHIGDHCSRSLEWVEVAGQLAQARLDNSFGVGKQQLVIEGLFGESFPIQEQARGMRSFSPAPKPNALGNTDWKIDDLSHLAGHLSLANQRCVTPRLEPSNHKVQEHDGSPCTVRCCQEKGQTRVCVFCAAVAVAVFNTGPVSSSAEQQRRQVPRRCGSGPSGLPLGLGPCRLTGRQAAWAAQYQDGDCQRFSHTVKPEKTPSSNVSCLMAAMLHAGSQLSAATRSSWAAVKE
eukprot:364362-Chlamydomonas_euryale.AAC.25